MEQNPFFETRCRQVKAIVGAMPGISLAEMDGIRLMNRTDNKFVTDFGRLLRLLELAADKYYAQNVDSSSIANYRTVYWDTPDHYFYCRHHNGKAALQKVRVRTYVDSCASFLEVKTKNNHGKTHKQRIAVASPDIDGLPGCHDFLDSVVRLDGFSLNPVVCNEFNRLTLINHDKTERLTIDFNIRFHNLETGNSIETGPLVVIELKRDGNHFSPILPLMRQLRIKTSGFSKYCIGSALTNSALKRNLFKGKLTRLSRLANIHIS